MSDLFGNHIVGFPHEVAHMYQEQAADYPAPTKEYTTETQAKGYIKRLEQTHFGAVINFFLIGQMNELRRVYVSAICRHTLTKQRISLTFQSLFNLRSSGIIHEENLQRHEKLLHLTQDNYEGPLLIS